MFKFLHAADMHLDSPLRGLERYEGAPVEAMRQATRQAFANLVQLALEEAVAFVLIAGDLYDGDWKDYNTGLYFTAQMAKLREAGISVYLIAGNHDAANRMTRSLKLPDNVRGLSTDQPETIVRDDLGVALHGQGFASSAVTHDLSAAYPPALPGLFNIGLLHTSADGREGHERYAPCTLPGLCGKRYDYWALGHIHQREVLHADPYIVFPGNIQGRHIRETGPKGCTLVTVDDAHHVSLEERHLDVLRWELCRVDAVAAEDGHDIVDRFSARLAELLARRHERPLALRVEIVGACPAHEKVSASPEHWTRELRARAVDDGGGAVWIEKVKLATSLPRADRADRLADGPLAELVRFLDELRGDDAALGELGGELAELLRKLPVELKEGGDSLRLDHPDQLRQALVQVQEMLVGRLLAEEGTP